MARGSRKDRPGRALGHVERPLGSLRRSACMESFLRYNGLAALHIASSSIETVLLLHGARPSRLALHLDINGGEWSWKEVRSRKVLSRPGVAALS